MQTRGHVPRLAALEWITFALLAALLSVTNLYTLLLTGWGEGGSIIAVLAAAALLGRLGRRQPTIETLNLAQTMASAGGSTGFAVGTYAAVKLVDPGFDPSLPLLIIMFIAMGVLGTMVGASVRSYMVRYFFPSGTACAVIQRTISQSASEAERQTGNQTGNQPGRRPIRRPIRLLALWGAIASLATIPTKLTLSRGTPALLGSLPIGKPLGAERIALGVEPLLYGIGIVVGPRVGLGMLLGGLSAPYIIEPALQRAAIDAAATGDWIQWVAIALLTVPAFATILFAYLFRQQAMVPSGFEPGAVVYRAPRARNLVYAALGIVALIATAITSHLLFELPFVVTVVTVMVAWPLCVMNGRVTGDTDINPLPLLAVVLVTLLAFLVPGSAIAVLGMIIVGGTLAGMAVDMMQDYRTGFLVNANPTHQTTVQFLGVIVGVLVAVPLFALIDARMGFGVGMSLPAPGAQIWAAMAKAFSGESTLTSGMIQAVIIISAAGSAYALLTVWQRTAAWMPSLFGMGIGLLLPIEMSAAVFVGGTIKLVVTEIYKWRERDPGARALAAGHAGNDTMLVGSAIFAASAIVSVLLVLVTELMRWLGIGWFYMAGQ
jgi:uncharacterized oligopeptide transporter (OPT) family protein